jgi:hypothetical protein
MQYKMVVRRTMFDFDLMEKGSVRLRSVHFLNHATMKQQNDLLLVTENDTIQFFLDGATPVAHLSPEQFKFVSAASRYFGHMPDQEQLPVWLWAGSLDLPEDHSQPIHNEHHPQPEPAYCG